MFQDESSAAGKKKGRSKEGTFHRLFGSRNSDSVTSQFDFYFLCFSLSLTPTRTRSLSLSRSAYFLLATGYQQNTQQTKISVFESFLCLYLSLSLSRSSVASSPLPLSLLMGLQPPNSKIDPSSFYFVGFRFPVSINNPQNKTNKPSIFFSLSSLPPFHQTKNDPSAPTKAK